MNGAFVLVAFIYALSMIILTVSSGASVAMVAIVGLLCMILMVLTFIGEEVSS